MCFRHQLPITSDCLFRYVQHVTRMACDRRTECVSDSIQDQTTQDTDDCSLLTEDGTLPSLSDSGDINWCKSTDLHNVVGTIVETGTAMDHRGCRDECTSITLISYCLAQYISTLEVEHQNRVKSLLLTDTVSWISEMFR